MTRLLMLVEGQSEEIFVKDTLAPYLAQHGVYVQPIVLWTQRLRSGGGLRGGVSNWGQICRSLSPLTRDGNAWVGTLLKKIGIAAVRAACPHFDGWLRRLEALGKGGA